MLHHPQRTFFRCMAYRRGEYKAKIFLCLDQFVAMVEIQLTYRRSLRSATLKSTFAPKLVDSITWVLTDEIK